MAHAGARGPCAARSAATAPAHPAPPLPRPPWRARHAGIAGGGAVGGEHPPRVWARHCQRDPTTSPSSRTNGAPFARGRRPLHAPTPRHRARGRAAPGRRARREAVDSRAGRRPPAHNARRPPQRAIARSWRPAPTGGAPLTPHAPRRATASIGARHHRAATPLLLDGRRRSLYPTPAGGPRVGTAAGQRAAGAVFELAGRAAASEPRRAHEPVWQVGRRRVGVEGGCGRRREADAPSLSSKTAPSAAQRRRLRPPHPLACRRRPRPRVRA